MPYLIDPARTAPRLQRAIDEAATPRQAQLIRQVQVHLQAEISADLPALMATLVDEPTYHVWNAAGPVTLTGREMIEQLYQDMFDLGTQQFEFDISKVVASDSNVVTEGRMRQLHTAELLRMQGLDAVNGEAMDEDGLWLSDAQVLVVWPAAQDGRLVGEDTYYGEDPLDRLIPIRTDEIAPTVAIRR